MNSLYEDLFSDVMSYDDFNEIKTKILENSDLENDNLSYNLNEGAEGADAGAWIKGLPLGIGSLLLTGLTAIGTLGALAGTAIKDKYRMAKLKNLMNRCVETVDNGNLKKKPWYSFLLPGRKKNYVGEYNSACFRSIQERADRNMCIGVCQAAYKLGYFAQGNMMNISNSENPQPGSGLDAFNQNVLSKLNVIVTPQ